MTDRISRREFLEKTGKTALGVGLGVVVAEGLASAGFGNPAPSATSMVSPNEKVSVGVIGSGSQGRGLAYHFLDKPDAQVIAVCDVDTRQSDQLSAKVEEVSGKKPAYYKDFRKLLERKDIDAVIVATPDHWHALPVIAACEAGKDVYVEKPLAHNITEGRAMVAAAKRYNRVVQVGTWQRSVEHFQRAVEFVRSGKMGKIAICRAWASGPSGIGKEQPCAPPKELDWDFWLGPAPKVPYQKDRLEEFRHFFDYGGGQTTDWGVHMIDIVLLGMNSWHPTEVASCGGKLISPADDDRETPDTLMAVMSFPTFVLQWEAHANQYGIDGGDNCGTEFIGENGSLLVDRVDITWKPRSGTIGPGERLPGDPCHVEGMSSAVRDFLDNVKFRGKCNSDIETAHHTTTACHLANISYLLGRSVKWDAKKQEILGDREAMNVLSYRREYRKPWRLPV